MFILNLWGEIRELALRLDMVAFSYIDNAYELFFSLASQSIIEKTVLSQIIKNIYVLVGIFAFFRIAVFLINSIINPDALQKEGAGLSKIFINTVFMIILLVFMPTFFEWSREITTMVVENNYVQKLFINQSEIEKDFNPGKEMQRISIGAAINVEEDFLKDDGSNEPSDLCGGDCQKAVKCINDINGIGDLTNSECVSDKGVRWGKLADYNGLREKDSNGDKLYVFNYKLLVLTVVGWFITYMLLSFSFDLGKRMIELAILEILSPIFIATMVDPKSLSSGPLSRWLKALRSSYLSLYLRIAAVSILLLSVKLLTYWKSPMKGGLAKLVVLIAFLIFIKQLPKWISNLLGMDGDGTGLGSLGIGKKIGEAALIGGLATKAGHGLISGATTLAGNVPGAVRDIRENRKANKKNAAFMDEKKGVGSREGRKYIRNEAKLNAANSGKGRFAQYKAGRQAIRDKKREYNANYGERFVGSMGIGMIEGMKAGVHADSVKGAFTAGKGVIGTHNGQSLGMQGTSMVNKVKNAVSSKYNDYVDSVYGNAVIRNERNSEIEKSKVRESSVNTKKMSDGVPLENVVAGSSGEYSKMNNGNNRYQDSIIATALRDSGYNVSFEGGKIKVKNPGGTVVDGEVTLKNGTKANLGDGTLKFNEKDGRYEDNGIQKLYERGSDLTSDLGLERMKSYQASMESNALSQTVDYNSAISQLNQTLSSTLNQSGLAKNLADSIKNPVKDLLGKSKIETLNFSDGSTVSLSNATVEQLGKALVDPDVMAKLISNDPDGKKTNDVLRQFKDKTEEGKEAEARVAAMDNEAKIALEYIKQYQAARDALVANVQGALASTGTTSIEEAKIKVDKKKSEADENIKVMESKGNGNKE